MATPPVVMVEVISDEVYATIQELATRAIEEEQMKKVYRQWVIDWRYRALAAERELDRIRPLIGMHDPTGADHMDEMMAAVERAQKAEAELARVNRGINWTEFSQPRSINVD